MNELVRLENGEYGLVQDAVDTIVAIENQIKTLKEAQDGYKETLLKIMEEHDIKDIDIPELKVTRVLPTTKETFDSKRFRSENPDLYDEYVNISEVKSSIRIKVK
jgi:regulator of replication initiation timing